MHPPGKKWQWTSGVSSGLLAETMQQSSQTSQSRAAGHPPGLHSWRRCVGRRVPVLRCVWRRNAADPHEATGKKVSQRLWRRWRAIWGRILLLCALGLQRRLEHPSEREEEDASSQVRCRSGFSQNGLGAGFLRLYCVHIKSHEKSEKSPRQILHQADRWIWAFWPRQLFIQHLWSWCTQVLQPPSTKIQKGNRSHPL